MELRVKQIIKERGITMQKVADELGIARDTLTRNINGNPTLNTLERIASVLNVPVSSLINDDQTTGCKEVSIVCPHCQKVIRVELKTDKK